MTNPRHNIKNTYCPSLKYSFSVVLNFFEYLTNSFFRCSTACLPVTPGINEPISLTTSSSFFMALAISLWNHSISITGTEISAEYYRNLVEDMIVPLLLTIFTHLMVSRKVLRSLISSGMRLSITLSATDLRFSSWNGSSVRVKRYSFTTNSVELEKIPGTWLSTLRNLQLSLWNNFWHKFRLYLIQILHVDDTHGLPRWCCPANARRPHLGWHLDRRVAWSTQRGHSRSPDCSAPIWVWPSAETGPCQRRDARAASKSRLRNIASNWDAPPLGRVGARSVWTNPTQRAAYPLTCVKMGLSITGRTRDEVGSRSPMVIF